MKPDAPSLDRLLHAIEGHTRELDAKVAERTAALQTAQQHDRNKVADVQRSRCRIEAHIARHNLALRQFVERRRVRNLVDIAPVRQGAQQV